MTAIFESKQGEEAFIVPPTYDSLQNYYAQTLLSVDELKSIEKKVVSKSESLAREKKAEIEE